VKVGNDWGGVTKARTEESGVIGEGQRSRPTQLDSLSERCKLPRCRLLGPAYIFVTNSCFNNLSPTGIQKCRPQFTKTRHFQ